MNKLENSVKDWEIKTSFIHFFDGIDIYPGEINGLNTFIMGITDLSFDNESNTLTVELRRPGLLIGKAGSTINRVKEHLDVEINIKEKLLVKHRPDKQL